MYLKKKFGSKKNRIAPINESNNTQIEELKMMHKIDEENICDEFLVLKESENILSSPNDIESEESLVLKESENILSSPNDIESEESLVLKESENILSTPNDIESEEYWEHLLEHPDYNTDTGNGRFSKNKGSLCIDVTMGWGEKKIGVASGDGKISLKQAFTIMREMPEKPMLLIRTSTRGLKSPGSFYVKGFQTKGSNFEVIKTSLESNHLNKYYSTRKAWLNNK